MTTEDFDKLVFTEDYGFEGSVSFDFFGKETDVTLYVQTDDDTIEDIQKESYENFIKKWDSIKTSVIEKIIGYYNDEERFSYGPDDKDEFARWWPEINTVEEMTEQLVPDFIVIPEASLMEDVYGGRCVFLTFQKKWGNDIEQNGVGVQILGDEVGEIGFAEIAY